MNPLFETHLLNEDGLKKAQAVASLFTEVTSKLSAMCEDSSREWSIAQTKLEEAAFFTKKAIAKNPTNQLRGSGESNG